MSMLQQYATLLGSVLLLTILFHVAERMFPAEKGQPVGRLLFNVSYTPFMLAAVIAIGVLLGPIVAFAVDRTGGGLLASAIEPRGSIGFHLLVILSYALVFDLCQYALHRLQHAVPFLWETHRFHHDETALNAAAQTRVHATSYALSVLFYIPAAMIFGLKPLDVVSSFVLFQLWGFVNHANLRVGFGPLTPLLSSPQWHRIHHSREGAHRDKNFAIFFPFIDMLFGTYYRPRRGEYPATGLSGKQDSPLRAATIGPLLAWYAMARSFRSARRSAEQKPSVSG
jgi:sterol desaturase/sphingolipid hydroxylase (fatty acid hydroxylase superfamily)